MNKTPTPKLPNLPRLFVRDVLLWFALLALIVVVFPARGQVIRHKALFDAIDCTSLTGKKANQFCFEADSNTWWVCEPTSGDCDTPGEWIEIAAAGGGSSKWTDTGSALHPNDTGDEIVLGATSPVSSAKLSVDGDADQIQLLVQGNSTQTADLFVVEDSAGVDALTVQGDGDVGLGTASPDNTLHVHKGSAGSVTGGANSPLIIENSDFNFLQLLSPNTVSVGIAFGDPEDTDIGLITYDHTDDSMEFKTNNVAAFSIDSAQDVTIPSLIGQINRNNLAVDEDDCTGLQGDWWYDTTDGRFEFCNAGAGAPAILAGGGGAGAFADAADPVVLQSVGKDVVIGPAQVNTSKLTIDGDADQVQVTIQGNSTQTADLFVIENSGGTELVIVEPDGEVGIGTGAPDGTLHVHTGSAGSVTADPAGNELVVESAGATGISILSTDAATGAVIFGTPSDNLGAFLQWNHNLDTLVLATSKTGASVVLKSGNGSEAVFIESTFQIGMKVAAADPSTVANRAHVYAKDVTASAEVFVQDEAGNATQISPHDPETGEWIFYSRNTKTGRTVRVNMERMIRKLEELTGEMFIEESWE